MTKEQETIKKGAYDVYYITLLLAHVIVKENFSTSQG
jgi:hypothetical protein